MALNNATTLKEIKSYLARENIILSITAIYNKMKKIGLTRKRLSIVPIERNSVRNKNVRTLYAENIGRYDVDNLVFLDETGFNKHVFKTYGYSTKNTSAYVQLDGNRGTNITCLAAISKTGVVGFTIFQGGLNTEKFLSFIHEQLEPYFLSNPNKILIMDNAAVHKGNLIRNAFLTAGINVKYLPPYSPQLNPIEEFFSMIKSRFATLRNERMNDNIETIIAETLNETYRVQCEGFYGHMLEWMERARQGQDFI